MRQPQAIFPESTDSQCFMSMGRLTLRERPAEDPTCSLSVLSEKSVVSVFLLRLRFRRTSRRGLRPFGIENRYFHPEGSNPSSIRMEHRAAGSRRDQTDQIPEGSKPLVSLITSKCTTCDHFKVHHSGWGVFGGWRGGWQGGNASQGSFLAGRS